MFGMSQCSLLLCSVRSLLHIHCLHIKSSILITLDRVRLGRGMSQGLASQCVAMRSPDCLQQFPKSMSVCVCVCAAFIKLADRNIEIHIHCHGLRGGRDG